MIDPDIYFDYQSLSKSTTMMMCWRCKKSINESESLISILQESSLLEEDTGNGTIFRTDLCFHIKCFKQIAGSDYIVNISGAKL